MFVKAMLVFCTMPLWVPAIKVAVALWEFVVVVVNL